MNCCRLVITVLLLLLGSVAPTAEGASGRLLGSAGVASIEGSAGGGLTPWAVIAGYGSETEWGGSAHVATVSTDAFSLRQTGVALGWRNRLELSLSRQQLNLPAALPASLPDPRLQVFGAKLRVHGDLLYGAGPQWSLGLQHKRLDGFELASALGAGSDQGTDVYLSVSKLWLFGPLGRQWLGSATVRSSEAWQGGLLGFGGATGSGRQWLLEGSLAVLLNRHWALGFDYRQKPRGLAAAPEDDWQALYLAWFPAKRWSLAAAAVDLGEIGGFAGQRGAYLLLQWNR